MQEMQKTPVWSLVRKVPWRRKWQSTPVFLPEKSHGQRGSWATVLGISKSQTRLSTHAQQEQAPGDLASVINRTTQFESLPFPEFLMVVRIRWLWPLNPPERQGALAASLITTLHRLSEPKVDWKEESRGLKGESVSAPVSMVLHLLLIWAIMAESCGSIGNISDAFWVYSMLYWMVRS